MDEGRALTSKTEFLNFYVRLNSKNFLFTPFHRLILYQAADILLIFESIRYQDANFLNSLLSITLIALIENANNSSFNKANPLT